MVAENHHANVPLQERERWGPRDDLIAASEDHKQHWPHKAKS